MDAPPHLTPPVQEIRLLSLAVAEALGSAEAGRLAEGYAHLLCGLERVREYRESWAPTLVSRWETAVEHYCREYGLRWD